MKTPADKLAEFQEALHQYTQACMILYRNKYPNESMRTLWDAARLKLIQLYNKELPDER